MHDMGVSYTFHNFTESFLRNGVLILNGKDNKVAGTIYLEIRIPKKKQIIKESPIKKLWK